jgi:DNA-binding transcriptional MocR family regulator
MLHCETVLTVPRDRDGLTLEQLDRLATGKRVVLYVCPDFQNPTGETMSLSQRRDLADWVKRNDALVVDDEIFRDLRFEGESPPSLYSMLPPGRRILVSSISKSFMTGLRCGFLAADRAIANELLVFKRYLDLGGPSLTQAIAAAFLNHGYEEHLGKMHALYKLRRDAALAALEKNMAKTVSWTSPEGGFQLWVTMPPATSSIQLFLQGIEHDVAIVPGPAYDVDGRYLNSFRLGYGACTPEEIRTGVGRLARIIDGLAARLEQGTSSGLGIV